MNRTPTDNSPEALARDLDTLTRRLLDTIGRAPEDPLIRAFACLSAAAQVCVATAEAHPRLRVRLARAALVLVHALADDIMLRDTPSRQQQSH